jgi:serine/threonine protein kinase
MKKFADEKIIAKGAYGSVYLTMDTARGEKVILKKVKISKNIKKNKREYFIPKMLSHPNLIKCHEAYYNKSNIIYVFEYYSDSTLRDYMKKELLKYGLSSEREIIVKNIMKQLRDVLLCLYDNNIIHRDIKPENILIKDNMLKLIDFGMSNFFKKENLQPDYKKGHLVKEDGTITNINPWAGTIAYMAPELLKKMPYNIKSDLWSCGILLYEMLYDKRPYPNTKESQINNKIEYDYNYSDECMDLMKFLLMVNVKDRCDWEYFRNHKWFCDKIISNENLDQIILVNEDKQFVKKEENNNTNNLCIVS